MIEVQSADGVIHQFPDGTDQAVIDRSMKAYASTPEFKARVDARPIKPGAGDFMRTMVNGLTFNYGPEVFGAINAGATGVRNAVAHATGQPDAGYGMREAFNAAADQERSAGAQFAVRHPAANMGGNLAGAVINPVNALTGGYVAGAPNFASAVGRSAITGAATGAAYGSGAAGPGRRMRGAVEGGATGAVVGAAVPVAARGARAGAARLAAPKAPKAPSLEQLAAQRSAAYQGVRDSNVAFTPEAYDQLTNDITDAVRAARFNPKLHSKTAAMLDYLHELGGQKAGYAPSLDDLDQIRQVVYRDVASSPEEGEQRMGGIIRRKIDDFLNAAGPEHLSSDGDPAEAVALLRRARDLNTRVEKLNSLDQLDEAASDRAAVTNTGGNRGNATRQNVLRFKNKENNLTSDEEAAVQRVIDGTPLGNTLRQVGRLSPQGNGLMLAGHLVAAVPTGGKSALIAAGGALAKAVSEAMTRRDVQALRDLIANGGDAAAVEVQRQLAQPQNGPLRDYLTNALTGAVGLSDLVLPGQAATATAQTAP